MSDEVSSDSARSSQARRDVGSYRTCVIDVFIAFLRTRDRWGWCVWEATGLLLELRFHSPNPLSVSHLLPFAAPLLFSTFAKQLSSTWQKPGELLGGCQGMASSLGKHSGQILAAPRNAAVHLQGCAGDTVEPEPLRAAPGHRAVGSLC